MKKLLLIITIFTGLLLVGCGGDSDSGNESDSGALKTQCRLYNSTANIDLNIEIIEGTDTNTITLSLSASVGIAEETKNNIYKKLDLQNIQDRLDAYEGTLQEFVDEITKKAIELSEKEGDTMTCKAV